MKIREINRQIDNLIAKRTLAPASQKAGLMAKIRKLRAERDLLLISKGF